MLATEERTLHFANDNVRHRRHRGINTTPVETKGGTLKTAEIQTNDHRPQFPLTPRPRPRCAPTQPHSRSQSFRSRSADGRVGCNVNQTVACRADTGPPSAQHACPRATHADRWEQAVTVEVPVCTMKKQKGVVKEPPEM